MTQEIVTYEKVSAAMLGMLKNGIKPTVRGVLAVTGGKTETVSGYIHDFNTKRDEEVNLIANEIGSSEIGALIATQIQLIVEKKTEKLAEITNRQKEDIIELNELLSEKQADCDHEVDLIKAQSSKEIDEYKKQLKVANDKADTAVDSSKLTVKRLEEAEAQFKADLEKIEIKAEQSISSANDKAKALIDSADKRVYDAEAETKMLRQQVNDLTVDEATRNLEKQRITHLESTITSLQNEYADLKTKSIVSETENTGYKNTIAKQDKDLESLRELTAKHAEAQGQLVELQKNINQLQTSLAQVERERDALAQAMAYNQGGKQ